MSKDFEELKQDIKVLNKPYPIAGVFGLLRIKRLFKAGVLI